MPEQPRFPPVVYVPTTVPDEAGQSQVEMAELSDGRIGLFCYSAMDRLAEYYRSDAPWVLMSVADLQAAYEQAPWDVLFLDRTPQQGDPS